MEKYQELIEALVKAAEREGLSQDDLALVIVEGAYRESDKIYQSVIKVIPENCG